MKNLVPTLGLAGMLCTTVSLAGENGDLNVRFQSCMSPAGCPLQENLSLIKDMSIQSSQDLQSIAEFCRETRHENCISDQGDKISHWRLLNERAGLLMKRVEAGIPEEQKNLAEKNNNDQG